MKVFVSTSAEVTQQTLKRKLKIGTVLQLTAVVKPDVVGTLGRGKTSVNLAHTYTVTDIEMTKSGDIKNCTLSVKGAVPSPASGLKSVEVLTAAALIKLLSTKINKDSKIGTKTLKFVVSKSKADTGSAAKDPKSDKLDSLKGKLDEASAELKEAKAEFTKAQRAYTAAEKVLERAEEKQAKAELALGSYNSKAGNVKLPVVGQTYKVRMYGTPPGMLVKPGAKAPKKWNDLGNMKVVSIEKGFIECVGKTRRLFKVADVGTTVKFTKTK